jgi:hypothetical protein
MRGEGIPKLGGDMHGLDGSGKGVSRWTMERHFQMLLYQVRSAMKQHSFGRAFPAIKQGMRYCNEIPR